MSAAHSTAHRQHYTPATPAERSSADSHSANADADADAEANHPFQARAALAAVYILAGIVLGAILTGAIQ